MAIEAGVGCAHPDGGDPTRVARTLTKPDIYHSSLRGLLEDLGDQVTAAGTTREHQD
jgi:hypothetical protein